MRRLFELGTEIDAPERKDDEGSEDISTPGYTDSEESTS